MNKKVLKNQQRLERLRALVAHHKELYHTADAPEISDEAYDALVRELMSLEETLEGRRSAVSESVGGTPSVAFTKVKHIIRQWSFDNVFGEAELKAWEERLLRFLTKQGVASPRVDYVTEHKIDGLKVVLEYKKGVFYRALTRGDGVTGEDVTHTALTLKDLPLKLPYPIDMICVGEVWLGKAEFETINRERQTRGEPLFANPRNAAAGSLRQLDSAVAKARNLSLFVYDIDRFISADPKVSAPTTQFAELALLKKLGFPVNKYARVCQSIKDIQAYFEEWKVPHNELPYGVDGVVIKLNDIALQTIAGHTAKSPRFGVAYKFPAVETTTVVEAIELQVGRTGVITPVAHLRPVLIDGSIVARATLHNEDQIKRLDIRVGDTVILRKAGDVIPEVVAVLTDLRPEKSRAYQFPKKVALCGGDGSIKRIPGTAAYRCVSLDSDFLRRQQLYYFVSKTALNIDGVGPRIIDALLEQKLIKDAADLFTLTVEDFLTLSGFKTRSAQNAVTAIASAKQVTFSRLLVGLSIEHVGEETAKLLAQHFTSPDALREASFTDLEAINGVGEVIARTIIDWQNNKPAQQLLDRLLAHLTLSPEESFNQNGRLAGKTFVFTGTLEGLPRSEAESLVEKLGGNIGSAVTRKTDFVVVGDDPGSKAKQAKLYGVKMLSLEDFKALVEG